MLEKFNQKVSEGFLFTDQYQLVMSQLYFKNGLHEKEAQFDHFFRSYPDYGNHKAGYCINAGLEWFIDWMRNTKITDDDIEYLKNHKNPNGDRIFHDDYLDWLKKNGSFDSINIKAIPEGRVVHPNEPLTIAQGQIGITQIMETPLLTQMNYQVLIATKASRIKLMGKGQPLVDFGMRRGHDRGANAGARAAMIGGADFSSNVGTSYLLGLPPKGTHAHAMVQLYLAMGKSEEDAFQAFADLYPDDCILLVDTIDTLESGIPNAIKVFERLKKKGHKPAGIRLDSGDLAYLTVKAAKLLNEAGFEDVNIVLSNELDEMNIWQIITQIKEEAPKEGLEPDSIVKRLMYGVGTRLITSKGDAALGGVYKLVAEKEKNNWQPAIKISESKEKIPHPGNKQVWRIYDEKEKATADLVALRDEEPKSKEGFTLHHPYDESKQRNIDNSNCKKIEPLLVEIQKDGEIVYEFPSIEEIRKRRDEDLVLLDSGVKRLINPHNYHVSLSDKMLELKNELIKKMKE